MMPHMVITNGYKMRIRAHIRQADMSMGHGI